MDISDYAKEFKTHSELLRTGTIDNYSNFIGEIVPDTHVCVFSRSRDSDGIEIVNYEAILEAVNEIPDSSPEDSDYRDVYILSVSHWACGWVDSIFIRKDTPQLLTATELISSLENYPLLDDDKYSAHCCAECNEYQEDETDLSENHLCDFCEKQMLEKELSDLSKELNENLENNTGYFITYDKLTNTFLSADWEAFEDEIFEAYQEKCFFCVSIAEKTGHNFYYTIAQNEQEALNDIDIFLSGNYYTASPSLFTLNMER